MICLQIKYKAELSWIYNLNALLNIQKLFFGTVVIDFDKIVLSTFVMNN
jgi:hypothetical protein